MRERNLSKVTKKVGDRARQDPELPGYGVLSRGPRRLPCRDNFCLAFWSGALPVHQALCWALLRDDLTCSSQGTFQAGCFIDEEETQRGAPSSCPKPGLLPIMRHCLPANQLGADTALHLL